MVSASQSSHLDHPSSSDSCSRDLFRVLSSSSPEATLPSLLRPLRRWPQGWWELPVALDLISWHLYLKSHSKVCAKILCWIWWWFSLPCCLFRVKRVTTLLYFTLLYFTLQWIRPLPNGVCNDTYIFILYQDIKTERGFILFGHHLLMLLKWLTHISCSILFSSYSSLHLFFCISLFTPHFTLNSLNITPSRFTWPSPSSSSGHQHLLLHLLYSNFSHKNEKLN